MEATFWNLENKWNLTTQQQEQALVLFVCITAMVVVLLCALSVMILRKSSKLQRKQNDHDPVATGKVLMRWVRWSGANKWDETPPQRPPRRLLPCLGRSPVCPLWQRPILMGEKCELPRFSGLILYDDKGRLLKHSLPSSGMENTNQEKPAVRTTLKDLL